MLNEAIPDFDKRLSLFESSRFTDLRPSQRAVLQAYAHAHLTTRDLAIEMPTGEGKTLVALLVTDYMLDQGHSVAYLTGTRQLAEQVHREATELGLDVVRFESGDYGGAQLDDYHQAQALGVMNYWVYFNSKPVPQPADLVIYDDAHLAEQPLSGLRTIRIPTTKGAARDLYRTICDLAAAHTDAYPGLRAMRDGTARPGTAPELLSFADWSAIASPVRDAIEASPFSEDAQIKHVWPGVRDFLERCGVLIGSSGIEIRPYHPPTTLNKWYGGSKQRIYLSATLGTMEDLQRRLGVDPITRLTANQPLDIGETGEKLLVLNPSRLESLSETVLDWALSQVEAAGGRSAWLCASHVEADVLENLLSATGRGVYRLRAGDDSTVDDWAKTADGQLITSGRYDGLDFPGDVCNLVIITSVPQASSEFERFVVAYLGDASFMRHRVGQRITQALGRANRQSADKSLYLGLDPAFAQVLAHPAVRNSIPDPVSQTIRSALELHELGWADADQACADFWARPEPVSVVEANLPSGRRKARPGRQAGGNSAVKSAAAETAAVADLWIGDHQGAVVNARQAATQLLHANETEHAAFWRYVEAHAFFDKGGSENLAAARASLAEAVEHGPRTTWFRRLGRTIAELDGQQRAADDIDRFFLTWDEWRGQAGHKLDRVLNEGRRLVTGSHDEQCAGLETLARLAGAAGERPPKQEQSATDCRWTWSTARRGERRVWEVKTGGSSSVRRSDVNQLLGQVEVDSNLASTSRLFGCLVTPATSVEADAAAAAKEKLTLFNHEGIVRLFDLLADRLRQYDALCGDGNAEARGDARTKVEKLLPADAWLGILLSPSNGKLLTPDDVNKIFPST